MTIETARALFNLMCQEQRARVAKDFDRIREKHGMIGRRAFVEAVILETDAIERQMLHAQDAEDTT